MEEDEAIAAAAQLTRALSGGAIASGPAAPAALDGALGDATLSLSRRSTEDEEAAALEAEERALAAQQAQLDAEAAEEAFFMDASSTAFQVRRAACLRPTAPHRFHQSSDTAAGGTQAQSPGCACASCTDLCSPAVEHPYLAEPKDQCSRPADC